MRICLNVIFSVVFAKNCADLLPGQYVCERPQVNNETQEYENCDERKFVFSKCYPLRGIRRGSELFIYIKLDRAAIPGRVKIRGSHAWSRK